MHVLMISLDSGLLGDDPHGNTVPRHQAYAERIGRLSIVVYNPAHPRRSVRRHSDQLVVYPTNAPLPHAYPWLAVRSAARIHRANPATLVTTQDPFATGLVGALLKWRFGLPLDVQNHSTFMNNPHWVAERPLRNRALLALGRVVLRAADTHRVLTHAEKRAYLALGVPADRIAVQPTPTDVARFAADVPPATLAARRADLGIAAAAPVILWVGFPAAFKHVRLLLAAYRLVRVRLPAARLVLAGDFSGRPDLAHEARTEGVILPGKLPHEALPPYYQMAQVYAHSSRYEGFGKVLVEALAAGTPVVSTRGDGPNDIIQHGTTGLLCDHNPAALRDAILTLLTDPDRGRAMGAAGRADVLTRYDYDAQLDAVVATFRRTQQVTEQAGWR